MELEGILAIGGKPGLYKLVAQSRGGVIVSSLTDDKKFPVTQASNVSSLKDIAIYTYAEEVPLADVFQKIADKENMGQAISHKEKPEALRSYMLEILEDYDQERVYNSDLKKLFQWYNILQENGFVTKAEEKTEEPAEEVSSDEENK